MTSSGRNLADAPSKSPLLDLAERVEAGTEPDRELDCLIQATTMGDLGRFRKPETWAAEALKQRWNVPMLTSSLDAVVALLERVLPEITDNSPADFLAGCIEEMMQRGWRPGEPNVPQIARSVLAALLRSLASKQEEEATP